MLCMRGTKAAAAAAEDLPACVRAVGDCKCTLAIHAKPGSRLAAVVAVSDVVELAIDAPAREGEANAALAAFLADALGVKKRDVTLQSGGKSREKVFCVQLPAAEAASRLRAAVS